MVHTYISALVRYGLNTGMIEECDRTYITNQILETLGMYEYVETDPQEMPLEDILKGILDYAVEAGLCEDDIISRDLLDTKLMGILTPMPREVRKSFATMYAESPIKATDWYYKLSQDTDYIRRYRINKDMRWKTTTKYGDLDITINLSKPEKDPKAIEAAKNAPQTGYPKCLLCPENEGFSGRMNHPARQNHRIIPVEIENSQWFLQYSPYVYYNEHCIVFNSRHTPMVIDKSAFEKLLDFVTVFPHYFIGSNADLPIVGGSILSHEHFQGGRYTFPMEVADVEQKLTFNGFEDIKAGVVNWPMSVIRLTGDDKARVAELADKILRAWRGFTDEDAFIFAETDGVPHNTITPIARRRGEAYEMDLVLRNNITTDEHPMGVFHPHAELHHIKKENIGLIEVMGLAVLPSRLKGELEALKVAILNGTDIVSDAVLAKHAPWAEKLKGKYVFTEANTAQILQEEVGRVFAKVLEHAGVYKRNPEGMDAGFAPRANLVFSAYSDEEYGGSHGALAAVLRYPCHRIVSMDGVEGQIWQCASGGQEIKYVYHTKKTVDSAKLTASAIPVVIEVLEKFANNRRKELEDNRFYAGTIVPETSLRYMGIQAGKQGMDLGVGEVSFVYYTDKEKDEIYNELHALESEISEKLAPMGIVGDGFKPLTRFFHYAYCEPDSDDIRTMLDSARETGGQIPMVCGSCLSDLSVISKYGSSEAYGFGMGRDFSVPGGAHQPDEYIECKKLLEYTKVIGAYILKNLG